jgi:hypothetical protein
MESSFAGICGISAAELTGIFKTDMEALAEASGKTYEETVAEMHKRYNGYHFSENSEGIFNPFSVLNTLVKLRFEYYWFRTGTPTFLVKALRDMEFDLSRLNDGISISLPALSDYRAGTPNLIPLLYQSGYLTIQDYDSRTDRYVLGFPNGEVRHGFIYELALLYTPRLCDSQRFDVYNFVKDLEAGDADAFMNRLGAFITGIPYELHYEAEKYYQNIFYILFKLIGSMVQTEVRGAVGRADMVVTTESAVFVFEFKLAKEDGKEAELLEAAFKQIDDKGYLIPYTVGNRRVVKIGAVFNAEKRVLAAWRAEG